MSVFCVINISFLHESQSVMHIMQSRSVIILPLTDTLS